jgi:hypothetical protein
VCPKIRCTVTEGFVSASHKTHWTFSCTEAIFKETQQQRSWWQKQCTEDINTKTLCVLKFICSRNYSVSFIVKML